MAACELNILSFARGTASSASSVPSSGSGDLTAARSRAFVFVSEVFVEANGLADDVEAKPDPKGFALDKFDAVEDAGFELLEANGDDVPDPNDANGLENGLLAAGAVAAVVVDVDDGVGAGEADVNDDVNGRPKFASTEPAAGFAAPYAGPREAIEGLAGMDAVPAKSPLASRTPATGVGGAVSISASGRGVSGGLTSVLMSDSASDGAVKLVSELFLGRADDTSGDGAESIFMPATYADVAFARVLATEDCLDVDGLVKEKLVSVR